MSNGIKELPPVMKIRDRQPKANSDLSTLREIDRQGTVPHPHEDIGFWRRNALRIGATATGVIVGAGALAGVTKAMNDGDPAERNDPQRAGNSQSAEPNPSPEVTPTPEVEPVELGYVTKAEHPKTVDALIALEERRLALISGTLEPSFEEWYAANPGKTTDDYMDVQLATVFGEGFDPKDPMVKNAKDLNWLFGAVNEQLKRFFEGGDLPVLAQYRISLGEDTEILGVNGTRVTYIPDFDVGLFDENGEKIPEGVIPETYLDPDIESMPENGNYEGTTVLAEEDDHWIIVD